MHVDEARGNDVVLRIDDAVGLGPAETPDRVDAVAPDGNVGTVPGIAGPVDDASVTDQQIVGLGFLRADPCRR